MAKTNKDSRRDVVDRMRREQKRAESRRTYIVVAAVVAVGLVIIGLGAYPLIKQNRTSAGDLETLGVAAADAGCQDVVARSAAGNNDHRDVGSTVDYPEAPPAFGPHYPSPAGFQRKFYSADDRPDLEYLVHNLEHGYTLLWYDDTIAANGDSLDQVRAIASKFEGDSLSNKFIAVPWTKDDGAAFPDGAHIALTHWTGGSADDPAAGQEGVWQYCAAPSGEAVSTFVEDYPYTNSPEPNAV